jgi:hypothetical protein
VLTVVIVNPHFADSARDVYDATAPSAIGSRFWRWYRVRRSRIRGRVGQRDGFLALAPVLAQVVGAVELALLFPIIAS